MATVACIAAFFRSFCEVFCGFALCSFALANEAERLEIRLVESWLIISFKLMRFAVGEGVCQGTGGFRAPDGEVAWKPDEGGAKRLARSCCELVSSDLPRLSASCGTFARAGKPCVGDACPSDNEGEPRALSSSISNGISSSPSRADNAGLGSGEGSSL